jgi:hypothetical protein
LQHFTAQVEAALGKTMGCNSSLSRSGPELLKRRKKMEPTLVHNLLAIADTHGFKNRSHADDERMCMLSYKICAFQGYKSFASQNFELVAFVLNIWVNNVLV